MLSRCLNNDQILFFLSRGGTLILFLRTSLFFLEVFKRSYCYIRNIRTEIRSILGKGFFSCYLSIYTYSFMYLFIVIIVIFTGKYLYIEASIQSTGDNAKLTFALPRNKSSCCLTFFYHMYGSAMGTLNVFSGNNTIFSKSGNQGNYWRKVTRTVYFSDMVSV